MAETVELRLISIALRHIRRDGLARMTIVRVAQEAGIAHSNVYRYFPSKAALAERIVADWLREIELRLNDIVQSPDPANDKLERYVTYLSRAYFEKAENDRQVFAIFADAAVQGEDYAKRHLQRGRELLSRILEEGSSTRVFASPDVRRLEWLVYDGMHRFIDPAAIWLQFQPAPATPVNIEARRDRLLRTVLFGLGLR